MRDPLQIMAEQTNEAMKRLLADWKTSDDKYEKRIAELESERDDLQSRLDRWNSGGNYIGTNAAIKERDKRIAELEALLTKADPLVGELQAENERLTDQHLDDVLRSAELEAENERLREEWSSARDDILHERGPLAESGADNDVINAVLAVLDDHHEAAQEPPRGE